MNHQKKNHSVKVVLITGAGEGIGKATALAFAAEGWRVACLGRHAENTGATVDEIESDGGQALLITTDISEWEEMQKAVEDIQEEWGRLDAVFANAGINGVWAPLEELEADEFNKTIQINLNGTFHTIKAATPLLKKRGGSVVITSSVNGTRLFSNSGATAYSCTKAAQVAMMKMLALELAADGIRVNCICPGAISTSIDDNTEQRTSGETGYPVDYPEGKVPLTHGSAGSPEDCANVVFFLCSEQASHLTGSNLYVDGAQALLQG